jgi:hypothetical protein
MEDRTKRVADYLRLIAKDARPSTETVLEMMAPRQGGSDIGGLESVTVNQPGPRLDVVSNCQVPHDSSPLLRTDEDASVAIA